MGSKARPVDPRPDAQVDYGKGLAWMLGFSIFTKASVAVIGIWVARELGPAEIGLFGILVTIYIFAEQMREAGLKQAYYNDNEIDDVRFRTYARMSVTSGVTFGLILGLLSHPLAEFFQVPSLAWSVSWAAFGTFLNGLSVIPMAALYKAGRFRDVGLIETGSNFLSALVALVLVSMGIGYGALVVQLVLRAGLQFAFAYWQRPYSILRTDRVVARKIMRACVPLVATDVLWLFYSLADTFTIGKLLRPADVGFYQQGKKILSVPGDLVFFPLFRTVMVAIGNRSFDPKELCRTFMKALSLAMLILTPIYGLSAIFAKPVVLALLGKNWAGTIPVLGIICLSEAFKSLGGFAGSALVAAGKAKIPLYAWLLPYPVAAVGIALTRDHWSLNAIAWSYALGMVAVNLVVLAMAFRVLGPSRKQVARFFECALLAAAVCGIGYFVAKAPLRPWAHVGVATLTLPTLYLAIIGTVFAKNPFAYFSKSGPRRLRESL